jgi:predicted DNA binding CopG/RHH family protein
MLDFCAYKSLLLRCRVKKKRMGRPLKTTGKPLTKRVILRMSDEELRQLKRKAKAKGLSVSEFLRKCGEE